MATTSIPLSNQEPHTALSSLAANSLAPLFEVKGTFPFDLLPDTVSVDQNKVDIIIREFPFFKRVYSNLIKNINAVTLTTGLFFATLNFEVTGYETNPPLVKWLPIHDAVRARRIITGLIVVFKEGIELSQVHPQEVLQRVEEIGKAREHPYI